MKNKIIFIIVCLVIFSPVFKVSAVGGKYLVKFHTGYVPDVYKYNLDVIKEDRGIYSTDNLELLKPVEQYIEYISENSEVHMIEGDEPINSFALQNDVDSEYEQLQMMKVDAGWKLEAYGNGVRVAVIDSGCFEHEDLKNNLLEGKNYLTGSMDVVDNKGHGTHVAAYPIRQKSFL